MLLAIYVHAYIWRKICNPTLINSSELHSGSLRTLLSYLFPQPNRGVKRDKVYKTLVDQSVRFKMLQQQSLISQFKHGTFFFWMVNVVSKLTKTSLDYLFSLIQFRSPMCYFIIPWVWEEFKPNCGLFTLFIELTLFTSVFLRYLFKKLLFCEIQIKNPNKFKTNIKIITCSMLQPKSIMKTILFHVHFFRSKLFYFIKPIFCFIHTTCKLHKGNIYIYKK